MPGLNTQVANLQGAATGGVCTAALAPLTGLGSDGSLPPKTSLVPIFEVGQGTKSLRSSPLRGGQFERSVTS